MMRSVGKLFGTAAGAAATTSQSAHCRSQPSRVAVPPAKIGGDWLVTDFLNALDNNEIHFEAEEIENTLDSLVPKHKVMQLSDSSSESGSEGADIHIRAAEQQMTMFDPQAYQFRCMLSNMLYNPGVQTAVLEALKDDPMFRAAVQSSPGSGPVTCTITELPDDGEGEEDRAQDGEANPLKRMLDDLAGRLKMAGEGIKGKAAGFRDSLGKFLIHMGASLHAFLGQPFSNTPIEESANEKPEQVQDNANERHKLEAVGYVLMTVAVAVLTIVLLKRVHPIRLG